MANAVPLGVIDSLSEGFATVNRRLWLLLLPILLDLLLLAGPGISVAPLVDEAIASLESAAPQGAGPDESTEQIRQLLTGLRGANLMGVVAWQVPSVVGATSNTLPKLRGPLVLEVHSAAALTGQAVALAVLGLLAASFYLAGLAGAVRRESFKLSHWAGEAVRGWFRYLALYTGLFFVMVPLIGFAVGLTAVLTMVAPEVASLVSALLGAVAVTVAFYLYFADDAIFLTGLGPLKAIAVSAAVVARNFGGSLAVFFAANLILLGIPLALRTVIDHPAGLVAASLVYAYVASGITAGAMVFFYQRLTQMRQALVHARGLPSSPRQPE